VLLSHADRTRINDAGHAIPLLPGNGGAMGTLLVDGFYRGTWKIAREGERATLQIAPFTRLGKAQADALTAEGMRLLAFAAADRAGHDVRVAGPG